jgi:hypothetical protein
MFSASRYPVFPATFLEETLFTIVCFWKLCQKSGCHNCIDSYLGFLFCSTGFHICFCASTMRILFLCLCSIVSSHVLFFFNSFIHMCIHCLGHFSPLLPLSCSPCHPPCFQAEPVLPLSLILLKRRHKHNKKDKAILLLELRVAIQRDS